MAENRAYIIARFWSKVRVERPTECWPWTGGHGDKGHGRFKIAGKLVSAHVFAYEYFFGQIPDMPGYHGAVVRHRCDNPPCCNPAHLLAGTQASNVADMVARGRSIGQRSSLSPETIATVAAAAGTLAEIAALHGATIDQVKWYRSERYRQQCRPPAPPIARETPDREADHESAPPVVPQSQGRLL